MRSSTIFNPYPVIDIRVCPDDLLQTYECSKTDNLREYLINDAKRDSEARYSSTKVYVDVPNRKVVGFYTIFVGNVKIEKEKKRAVGIKRHAKVKEIPCIKVLYFGLSEAYKGKKPDDYKFSKHLMNHLKVRCGEIGVKCGVCIVYLESYPGAEKFYQSENFLEIGKSGGSSLNCYAYHIDNCVGFMRSLKTPVKLVASSQKEVAATDSDDLSDDQVS